MTHSFVNTGLKCAPTYSDIHCKGEGRFSTLCDHRLSSRNILDNSKLQCRSPGTSLGAAEMNRGNGIDSDAEPLRNYLGPVRVHLPPSA